MHDLRSFRLSFGGFTTSSIPAAATGGDVAAALEALSSVGTVVVLRDGPNNLGAFNWTVTFTSDTNAGDIDPLVRGDRAPHEFARLSVVMTFRVFLCFLQTASRSLRTTSHVFFLFFSSSSAGSPPSRPFFDVVHVFTPVSHNISGRRW